MRKIEKPVEIEQGDSFKVILSKYGALGLDKQENLSELIGDLEGQLDIEKGNENIGFDESLIEAAKEIHEIGLKYEIGQFTTPEFETTFDDCHIWAMVATSILKMDGYYGVNMEGLDIFVAIKSDLIVENNSVLKFRDTFYTFQKNFEIFPKIAFESYTKLKGYPFKQKEEFAVAKLGESRIIASFTERGNVTHIQMLLEDE